MSFSICVSFSLSPSLCMCVLVKSGQQKYLNKHCMCVSVFCIFQINHTNNDKLTKPN